jgi:hypothetical protein
MAGGVRLSVEYCEFEGIDFSFTPQYGLLLLRDETKVEAQGLLKELAELPLSDKVIKDVIRQACDKGFKLAHLELERYRQFVPTDEPKFYVEMDYSKQLDMRVISLVTHEKTMRFYASADMRQVISQLPVNAYRFCTTYTGFSLTAERYKGLFGRETGFL